MNLRLALASLAALPLLACTGMEGGEGSVAATRSKVARFPHTAANADCFFQQRIDNFEVLNDSNLLVFDGRRRVYHVELTPPSMDLRHAYGIGFSSNSGRVCGNPGERLQISGGSLSRLPVSVIGVYRLDPTLLTSVRAHFGQIAPPPALPEDQDAEAVEELVTDIEGAAENSGEDSGEDSPPAPAESGQEN